MSTETKTVKYQFRPGIMRESTEYAAEGGWYDGNRIRFRDGKPESIRGWQKRNTSSFIGTGRALSSWASLDGTRFIALATEHKSYLYSGGEFHDITPYDVSVCATFPTDVFTTVSSCFNTSSGSSNITVSIPSHGINTNSYVRVCAWSTLSAPGGITSVEGDYRVSVVNANSFVIAVGSAANATSSSKGQAQYAIRLPSGNSVATGGYGYGSDIYNAFPTFAMTAYSSCFNFISGETTITVTVTNHNRATGSYVMVSAWPGAGLMGITSVSGSYQVSVIDTNSFHIVAGSAATGTSVGLGTSIYLDIVPVTAADYRAWNSPASATGITLDIRQWSLTNFGEDLILNPSPRGGIYRWDRTNGVATTAVLVTGAPVSVNHFIVSPLARQGMCLGATDSNGNFDPMLIRWSAEEDLTTWTATTENRAGSIRLANGSEIRGGLIAGQQSFIWTDTALMGMVPVEGVFVFNTRQLGTNCGLTGKHGAAEFDGRIFWMGDSNFYVYSGQVEVLPCTVKQYIFDDFNLDQRNKVYAGINSEFGEITWLYCSKGSFECDRYVSYSPSQNYWTFGDAIWTAWKDKDIMSVILTTGASIAVSANSNDNHFLYDNEPFDEYRADNEPMPVFIESGEFDLGDGDEILFIDRIIPDIRVSSGSLNFSVITKNHPNDDEITKGPFTVNSDTKYLRPRARGRTAKILVSAAEENTKFNVGSLRLDVMPDGKR